jgi:hypothetical protein
VAASAVSTPPSILKTRVFMGICSWLHTTVSSVMREKQPGSDAPTVPLSAKGDGLQKYLPNGMGIRENSC